MITEDIITEDYCSPEIVKLLKEKGFRCGATYSKGFVKDGDGFVGGLVRHEDNITHQRARKWLRKVYGFHISVAPYLNNEGEVIWVWEIINIETATIIADSLDGDDFNSCEEAVEAALKHVLESDYFPELKVEDEKIEFESKFKPGDWISNGRYLKKIIDINSDWPYYIFQDGSSYRIKEVDAKWYIMPNMDELEWIDMETNENHCYSCELFDRKNEMCKCSTLCKNYRNTYKGFYIR